MRRLLWWFIVVTAFAWTGFMAVYTASIIPDPNTAGIAQTFVWVVFAGIVLSAFWLLPMLGLWLLAWLVKPKDCISIAMRPRIKPTWAGTPPSESTVLFCESVNLPKSERRSEPYAVDGQVIAFRRPAQHSSNVSR